MDSLPFCAVENKLQTLIVYPILATILLILVFQEKNAAFTVVMGRLVIKGDAVPAAILSKGVW